MGNWKYRFERMMIVLDFGLARIAKETGFKESSLNSRLCQKDFSRWMKLCVLIFEACERLWSPKKRVKK